MPDAPFNARRHHIREDRSLLLDYLNSTYPAGLIEQDLLDVMLDLPDPVEGDLVKRDLGYLDARGLIEKRILPHPTRKAKVVRWYLTADGVSFIERDKPWSSLEGS